MKIEDKTSFVEEIFSSVANKYDFMNDLMSFGLHRIWKNIFVNKIPFFENAKVLDSASGTGDIAYKIFKKKININVTLCDRNIEMLSCGKNRFINSNILTANFVCADAENLPFLSDYFDFYIIAFGIRNVSEITKCLSEAYRVLKPNGRFFCLEFGHVQNKCFSSVYDMYSFNVIPFIGKKVTGNKEAYEYLVESIRKFPFKDEFIAMMQQVGFNKTTCDDISCGIVNIYSCIK